MTEHPILVFSDPHYHDFNQFAITDSDGLNSRLSDTIRATREAYRDLKSKGGVAAICAGDIFHVRGKIKPSVLNPVRAMFEDFHHNNLNSYMISGNHDLETEQSSDLSSSVTSLRGENVKVWSNEPTSIFLVTPKASLTLVPWEPDLNKLRKFIKTASPANSGYPSALVLHAPLNGVIKGLPDHGLTPDDFKDCKFDKVFIGHYHNHKSFQVGNCEVISVGSLTHQNFGDVEHRAGYLLWYPKSGRVEHVETGAPKFMRVDVDEVDTIDAAKITDNYVKIVNGEFDDPQDIADVRSQMIVKGARGVIVEGIVRKPAVSRGTTTSSTAPTIHSILGDYVDRTYPGEDDVKALALEILNEVYE